MVRLLVYEGSEQSIYCTKVAPDHFDWPIFLFGGYVGCYLHV